MGNLTNGFIEDGKFHPITQYKKGVRKSRDQKIKTSGVRLSRNRFHPKGYKPPTFGKKKPEGRWEITKTKYISAKEKFNCVKCGKRMAEANIGYDKMCHECFVEAKAERTMQEMIPRNVIEKYTRKYRDGDENLEEPDQLIINPDYDIGDVVMIRPEDDNEGYRKFRGRKLRIVHVATNRDEHQGFDEGVGQALYDLETIDGREVPFSLYDYELVSA